MQKLSFYIICLLTVVSCRSSRIEQTKTYRKNIPIVAFCDLPKYKGQLVYVKGFYSGVVEYWSFGIGGKKCNEELTVGLQFKGDNPFNVPKEFEDVLGKFTIIIITPI